MQLINLFLIRCLVPERQSGPIVLTTDISVFVVMANKAKVSETKGRNIFSCHSYPSFFNPGFLSMICTNGRARFKNCK
jgi:hypothetical protein